MCNPPPFPLGRAWASYQIFKKKKGGGAGGGGLPFSVEGEGGGVKYLMLNIVYKKMFFSVITKNLNWEVLNNNLSLSLRPLFCIFSPNDSP